MSQQSEKTATNGTPAQFSVVVTRTTTTRSVYIMEITAMNQDDAVQAAKAAACARRSNHDGSAHLSEARDRDIEEDHYEFQAFDTETDADDYAYSITN